MADFTRNYDTARTRALKESLIGLFEHWGAQTTANIVRAQPDDFGNWSPEGYTAAALLARPQFQAEIPKGAEDMVEQAKAQLGLPSQFGAFPDLAERVAAMDFAQNIGQTLADQGWKGPTLGDPESTNIEDRRGQQFLGVPAPSMFERWGNDLSAAMRPAPLYGRKQIDAYNQMVADVTALQEAAWGPLAPTPKTKDESRMSDDPMAGLIDDLARELDPQGSDMMQAVGSSWGQSPSGLVTTRDRLAEALGAPVPGGILSMGYSGSMPEGFRRTEGAKWADMAASVDALDPVSTFSREYGLGIPKTASPLGFEAEAAASQAEFLSPFEAFNRDLPKYAPTPAEDSQAFAPEVAASSFDAPDFSSGYAGDLASSAYDAGPFAERYGPSLMSQGMGFGDTPIGSMPAARPGSMMTADAVNAAFNGAGLAKSATAAGRLAQALAGTPDSVTTTNTAAKTDSLAPTAPGMSIADLGPMYSSAMGPTTGWAAPTSDDSPALAMMAPGMTTATSLFGPDAYGEAQSMPSLTAALMGGGELGPPLPERNPLDTQPGLRDYIGAFKGSVKSVGPKAKAAIKATFQAPTVENMVAMSDVFGQYTNANGRPSKAAKQNRQDQLSAFASANPALARALAGEVAGGSGETTLGGGGSLFGGAPSGPSIGGIGGMGGPMGGPAFSGPTGPGIGGPGGPSFAGGGQPSGPTFAGPTGPSMGPSISSGARPSGPVVSGPVGPAAGPVGPSNTAPGGGQPMGPAAAAAHAAAAKAEADRAAAEAAAAANAGYAGMGYGGYGPGGMFGV